MSDGSKAMQENGVRSSDVLIKQDEHVMAFDQKATDRLHIAYNQALADDKDAFVFDGITLVTDYAKYLLEYLEERLNGQTETENDGVN